MEQLGIIGAGPGGADLLKTFLTNQSVRIIGIADPNPQSPGIKLAKQHGIFTARDFRELANKPGRKMLFDATGVPAVALALQELASETNIVVPPEVARLIWEMVDAKEAVNRALVKESETLLSFIEQGLQHIETLNLTHEQAIHQAVGEIQALSQLTEESQTLVQETAAVMGLIKNVADQTRMLGINASIESARAGDHGRGFGVVADSIHKLSANALSSVSNVSQTMATIARVLESIDQSVSKVVEEVQKLESNQAILTRELHSSLEEMIESAQTLSRIADQTS